MEKFKFISIKRISRLPETAGVYLFRKGSKLIYIGKAINIKNRVKQHEDLLGLAEQLGYMKTDSEIEALILEAKLIKKYQPKYNTTWRDDKNYFYVAVTKESFPQVFITHQPKNVGGFASNIGPFVDGRALKETLKVLRKVFPYRTCNRLPRHACLWYQLQRCPAPCLIDQKIPGFKERMKQECQKNAKNLMTTLAQGKTFVLKKLKNEMIIFSRQQRFEDAGKIKNQIASLEKVFSHAQIITAKDNMLEASPPTYYRAEAYDIANIQGKEATGAMVVFIDGKPDKSQYRQFKIKGVKEPNDIAMLKEVLERRLKHQEWPYPDLMLIDGGKAQLNAALSITRNPNFLKRVGAYVEQRGEMWGKARRKFGFRVMSLAKKNNELYMEGRKKPVLLKTLPRETFNLILQLRDEAHRFARRYHHKLRKKSLLD
ncbi:MAG: UvrB/UvrC motif-containing protein [Candidatus Nealsonbacteria bacterium]